MPNGVICGGSVDGSNQLGAIVTCHAITARPDGADTPAVAGAAPRVTSAPSSKLVNARFRRRAWTIVMNYLPRQWSSDRNWPGGWWMLRPHQSHVHCSLSAGSLFVESSHPTEQR